MFTFFKLVLVMSCVLGALGEEEWRKTIYSKARTPSVDNRIRASPPKDQQHQGCGETRIRLNDGDHGIIESPGYPNSYKPGLDCEYRYESAPGTVILASVFDLRTHNALLSDISDSLYLSLSGNWSNSQRLSGDLSPITPMLFVSESNSLAVRFISSPFTQGSKGFRIGYYTRKSNSGKPAATEPAHDVYVVVTCNYFPVDAPVLFPSNGISKGQEPSVRIPTPERPERANPNPFLVALVLDDEQFCSGTLISDRHVVTSAHCTRGVDHIQMIFGTENLGVSDDGVQKQSTNGSSVTEHPYFDPYSGANDISVIELDTPVEITKFVTPASLPTWSLLTATLSGYKGEVVGWGDPTTGTVFTQAGRKSISISPNSVCSAANRNSNGHTMCSAPTRGSSCQADSGSPIVRDDAYCAAPVDQTNNGDNGINNAAQKPPRPQKPINPAKPSKPNRPNRPRSRAESESEIMPTEQTEESTDVVAEKPRYKTNLLLGLVSYGSCDSGFSFTRVTAYLDFLTRFVPISNDA